MADASALRAKLSEFLAVSQDNLVTRSQWGDITFEASKNDIDAMYGVVHLLNGLPLERLPKEAISQVLSSLSTALSWILRIDTFNLHDGSPTQKQQEITNNLEAVQEQLYVQTHQWIPFLAYLKGDIPAQLDAITASVSAAKENNSDFANYSTARKKDLDDAVSAAREASAKSGAAHFTKDFLNDATDREADATKWLGRSVWAAAITIAVAVIFFFIKAPDNQYAVIQFATSKIVILAMLVAITTWCASNYKANKHQATVSRHKGHSLQTFQAFVQASDNPIIKDAVLLETTRAIFTHNASGYLKTESSSDGPSRILEIVKDSGGKGEG